MSNAAQDKDQGLFGHVALFAGFAWLGVLLMLSTLLCLPLMYLFSRESKVQLRTRGYIRRLFDLYLRSLAACHLLQVDNAALDAIAGEKRLIVAANHPGLLDALILISRLPNASCIMKSSLMNNPLLGLGARMAGYIRNNSTSGLVRSAVADLDAGSHLVVFPEGTRTAQQPVNELGAAFATIARRAGVPVQVVTIEANSRFLGKGWPLLRRPVFPLRYQVRLAERIDPRIDLALARDAIVAQTDQILRANLRDGPFALDVSETKSEQRNLAA